MRSFINPLGIEITGRMCFKTGGLIQARIIVLRYYLSVAGARLPGRVGRDGDQNVRISDGNEGHLCYGPHCLVSDGQYVAVFYMRRLDKRSDAQIFMDVYADGSLTLAHQHIQHGELLTEVAGMVDLPFEIKGPPKKLEVRLRVPADVIVEVRELVIFSTNVPDWSAQ